MIAFLSQRIPIVLGIFVVAIPQIRLDAQETKPKEKVVVQRASKPTGETVELKGNSIVENVVSPVVILGALDPIQKPIQLEEVATKKAALPSKVWPAAQSKEVPMPQTILVQRPQMKLGGNVVLGEPEPILLAAAQRGRGGRVQQPAKEGPKASETREQGRPMRRTEGSGGAGGRRPAPQGPVYDGLPREEGQTPERPARVRPGQNGAQQETEEDRAARRAAFFEQLRSNGGFSGQRGGKVPEVRRPKSDRPPQTDRDMPRFEGSGRWESPEPEGEGSRFRWYEFRSEGNGERGPKERSMRLRLEGDEYRHEHDHELHANDHPRKMEFDIEVHREHEMHHDHNMHHEHEEEVEHGFDLDEILESKGIQKILGLMEENFKLHAKLELLEAKSDLRVESVEKEHGYKAEFMERRIHELEKALAETTEALEDSTHHMEHAHEHEAMVDELAHQNEALQEELDQLRRRAEESHKHADRSGAELMELRSRLQQMEDETNHLRERLRDTSRSLEKAQSHSTELKDEKARLARAHAEAEEMMKRVEEEKLRLHDERARLKEQAMRLLKDDTRELNEAKLRAMGTVVDKLTNERDQAIKDLKLMSQAASKSSGEKHDKLAKENAALRKSLQAMELKLKATLGQGQKNSTTSQAEAQKLKMQLERSHQVVEELESKFEGLMRERVKQEREAKDLRTAYERTKAQSIDQMKSAEAMIRDLQKKLADSEQKIEAEKRKQQTEKKPEARKKKGAKKKLVE